MRQKESTFQMKENYMELHFGEGLTPLEIAEKFNLSSSTVYDALGEIAQKNGVSRESLLKNPGRGNFGHSGGQFGCVGKMDPTGFNTKLNALVSGLDELKMSIQETLKEEI